jgi:glycosyltransferase involved in cell wall biosynthesis
LDKHRPWLTIVTVVKDDPDGLRATVDSITTQDLEGVEYVVIDSSEDRTVAGGALDGMRHRYSWMPPHGIYPAMNTGLALATGTYAYFANAGDVLAPGVLARVRAALLPTSPLWAFGTVDFLDPGTGTVMREPAWDYDTERRHFLARRHFPPHQAVFMQVAELRRQGGFDGRFLIVADYLSVLRAGTAGPPLHLDEVIATFATGGVSTTRWRDALAEFHRARREALDLRGVDRWHEHLHTADTWLRTAVYRGLIDR